MTKPTLEHLSDGLTSPFWEWFSAYVTREWGPSGMRYQRAVQEAAEDEKGMLKLQKVLHTQREVMALMEHPAQLLQAMRGEARKALLGGTASRRGPGL